MNYKYYVDEPRLNHPDEIYYTGNGCTWGIDLDGNRYWKRYSPCITRSPAYSHLSFDDIIDEKARIRKLIIETLKEFCLF